VVEASGLTASEVVSEDETEAEEVGGGIGLVVELGSSGLTSLELGGSLGSGSWSGFLVSEVGRDSPSDLYSLSSSLGVTMESRSG
jgi:hypothetical protein